jgi:PAS domain S-box-containing protein
LDEPATAGDWVDIGRHLGDLCAALSASSTRASRFDLSLKADVFCLVRPEQVAAIALIVGEAVTNAIKHAHPTGVAGIIEVHCRRSAGPAIVIDVIDDGVGLPEGFDPDADGGHGFEVMRGLSRQLGARLRFTSTSLGLRVRLRSPAGGKSGQAVSPRPVQARPDGDDQHYLDLLQALPAAVYTTDAAGRITFFNEAAVALWGQRPQLGDAWCGSWRLFWPNGEPMAHGECPMAIAINENRAVRGGEAIAERPDGTRVPFMAFPTPICDASGQLIGAVNTLVDISDRKRNEDRQKLLAREVHHRTKNLLSVVYSIVARGMDGGHSLKEARGLVLGRLMALAATYDNLITTSWSGVELGDIVRTELAPYPAQWRIEGPVLMLNPQAAQNFTLAVHELATNAAKYGALSTPAGRVDVRWSVDGAGRFAFVWQERDGPAVAPRKHRGFGSLVLERVIAQDFKGPPVVDFAPEGLTYALDVSLSAIAASEALADRHVFRLEPHLASARTDQL